MIMNGNLSTASRHDAAQLLLDEHWPTWSHFVMIDDAGPFMYHVQSNDLWHAVICCHKLNKYLALDEQSSQWTHMAVMFLIEDVPVKRLGV